ncbi:1-phosphatidylinositol-3-phosphate 5-kinase [Podochytrium sp. JEL0797]|nr:1-phosphatidylinositol-3-phosphate 5-kinase [Podochytrium sp. JEL0797]
MDAFPALPCEDMDDAPPSSAMPPPSSETTPPSRDSHALKHLRRLTHTLVGEQAALAGDHAAFEAAAAALALAAVRRLGAAPREKHAGGRRAKDAPFDLRLALKVKKVPGGSPADSLYVDGVVFSKRVAHKLMLATRQNPRVLLLAFPLEFLPRTDHFVSLETVLAQENDYLHLLLKRIIDLKPAVLLVGGNVSRTALDILVRANIALATNVKTEVLNSIARCSTAKIVQSIDQLHGSSVGVFGRYSVKVFDDKLIEGGRKSFVFLEGCEGEQTGTIIIRGGSLETLKSFKNVLTMVVFVAYNIFVEQFFLGDELALLSEVEREVDESKHPKPVNGTQLELALWKYQTVSLSASPFVEFPPPHILVRLQGLKSSTMPDPATPSISSTTSSNEQLISSLESNSVTYLDKTQDLSPCLYQKIVFLFSSICIDPMIPCQPAELHVIEYYSETDISVGMYIEELCANFASICPTKGCGLPMIQHFRSYAHGEGRISVVLEELEISVNGGIQMWTFCKHCKQKTPTVPLSRESWNYSFGKFLEIVFYMVHTRSAELLECTHDLHREHIRFFSYKQFVVRFEFEPLELLEVSVPTMKVQMSLDVGLRLKSQDYETRRTQIVKFYDSVVARIKHFANEVLPQDKVLLFKDFSNGLSKRASSEKKTMLQLLQQQFSQSSDMDSLALNAVFHHLVSTMGKWESDFSVLARSFFTVDLTKENTAKRIGSIHLRDIFSNHTTLPPPLPPGVKEAVMHIPLGSSPPGKIVVVVEDLSEGETGGLLSPPIRDEKPRVLRTVGDADIADDFGLGWLVTDSQSNVCDTSPVFTASAESLLGMETEEDPVLRSASPSFSMAARWRLEFIDDEEDESGAVVEKRNSNIVSVSSSNNELDESTDTPAMVFSNPMPIPSGERASILKTISALWSGSVANLPPLEYPLQASEHLFHDSLVIVREDEPSSIIAFTLSSNKYINKLKQWQMNPSSSDSIIDTNGLDDGAPSTAGGVPMTTASESAAPLPPQSNGVGDIEEKLTSGKGHHIKFEFWDGNTKLDCKAFYAEQFDALRRNCGFEDGYVHSLSRCIKWDALGGKSGSAFLKTRDDRLILKQLSRQEMEALLKFAPFYFTYISEAFFHKLPTVLAKLFGVYRIAFKNPTTNKSLKMDVLVMENLFWERNISRIFDLKGSIRNRHVQSTGKQNQVLLDENLLEYLCESPLFIREYSKRILRASVWNDTLFLSKMDVMDYSLLVGIDEEKKELVVGIVDYIRTFTWDKKLESWVKETGILGGGTTQPTILSPRQYKNRFRESMDRYFLTVTSFLEKVE